MPVLSTVAKPSYRWRANAALTRRKLRNGNISSAALNVPRATEQLATLRQILGNSGLAENLETLGKVAENLGAAGQVDNLAGITYIASGKSSAVIQRLTPIWLSKSCLTVQGKGGILC